jgi:hypothetical protein
VRHRHAEGKLTARRHVRETRERAPSPASGAVDSPGVYRHANYFRAVRAQERGDGQVARFFNPDLIARVEQESRNEIERVLGAGSNEHLLSIASDPARRAT